MDKKIIENNLNAILDEIKNGNNLGEKVTLIGATKYVETADIITARDLGLTDVGDNKVQEFRDKTSLIDGLNIHFIGRLQKNKVKYLIGKTCLIQSVDSFALAEEINKQSKKADVKTNILLEVNTGEEQKGGFPLNEIEDAVKTISEMPNISVKGLMAMFPLDADEKQCAKICLQIRSVYDKIIKDGYDFKHLSIGMSGDYKIAIKNGSNMIRVGTGIFGERDYTKKVY